MHQLLSQMPLPIRIPTLAQAVQSLLASKEATERELAAIMELLAQAEAEAVGVGIPLSGLIPEGHNPHLSSAIPTSDQPQGDATDALGKSSGDAPPAGS